MSRGCPTMVWFLNLLTESMDFLRLCGFFWFRMVSDGFLCIAMVSYGF